MSTYCPPETVTQLVLLCILIGMVLGGFLGAALEAARMGRTVNRVASLLEEREKELLERERT